MKELPTIEYNIGEEIGRVEERADRLEDEGDEYAAGLALYNFAEKIRKTGKIDDVLSLYKRAEVLLENTIDDENVINGLELSGRCNQWITDYEKARILFIQAGNMAEKKGMKTKAIELYRLAGEEKDIRRLGG